MWLALPGGCAGPRLEVIADGPPGTRLLVDGRRSGVDSVAGEQPYYGTIGLQAVPEPPPVGPELGERYRVAREAVELPPPITGWIFPLDFLYELGTAPWREWTTRVELTTPRRERGIAGVRPPRAEEFRARARQARTAR